MKRSTRLLLGAGALCLLSPYGAQARLLKNTEGDYCMGVNHGSKKDGADIKVSQCENKPQQQWAARPLSQGAYTLVNEKSGKCMGVSHARTTPGADIQQFECDGSDHQEWTFATCGGWPCIVNMVSRLCLSAQHLGHGVQVEQLHCDGTTNQSWAHP